MFRCYSYLNEQKDFKRNFIMSILKIRNKKENKKSKMISNEGMHGRYYIFRYR